MKKYAYKVLYWLTIPGLIVYLRSRPRSRVFVRAGDRVLVVKTHYGSGKWSTPGGGINKNETPVEAAARELYEETGITAKQSQLVFAYNHVAAYSKVIKTQYFMYILKLPKIVKTSHTSHEHTESKWVSLKEIADSPSRYSHDVLETIARLS